MISNLPVHVNVVFILTTVLTFGFMFAALVGGVRLSAQVDPSSPIGSKRPSTIVLLVTTLLVVWLFFQALLSLNGFYLNFDQFPPRFVLALLPPLLTIVLLFSIRRSREFILGMPIVTLTYLHVVRVPVEFGLLWLYKAGYIPELMTFEGRNFDILAGISAPFVAYFALSQLVKATAGALIWNFIALGLLFNIVINAVLSTPYPFQTQAFDQPNVAVFYFPFIWLPAFIVPVVLFAHLAAIYKLLKGRV